MYHLLGTKISANSNKKKLDVFGENYSGVIGRQTTKTRSEGQGWKGEPPRSNISKGRPPMSDLPKEQNIEVRLSKMKISKMKVSLR